MMENLFDCLCSLLLHTPNRDRFLRGEGLQLMNLMLREKKVKKIMKVPLLICETP
jgi:beta-catenin-like protein 1